MSQILLPDHVKTFQCQVPGCEEHFLEKSAYLRHVPRCVEKHRERLITASEEHQAEVDADPFAKVWDPEALEWVHKRRAEGAPGYRF